VGKKEEDLKKNRLRKRFPDQVEVRLSKVE
jgi:hypothetical protein